MNELVYSPRRFAISALAAILGLLATASVLSAENSVVRKGDRIAIVGNALADQMRKYGYVEAALKQGLPHGDLYVRHLGWAGDTLKRRARPENFASEEETLRTFKADFIIACFGIGESFEGKAGLPAFRENLQTLIEEYRSHQYNGRSAPRLALVTPMAFEDMGGQTPDPEADNRNLALYANAIIEVAKKEKLHYVDLFKPSLELMGDGEASKLTSNGIVLSPYGYWVAGHLIADGLISASRKAMSFSIGGLNAIDAENAAVSDFEKSGDTYQWKATPRDWSIPPPAGVVPHGSLMAWRDRLAAKNLSPGTYTLKVDGRVVARGTHQQWADGVVLEGAIEQEEIEEYRQALVDKNDQFFYSWKALNQVHIVGERRTSPSGQAIPGELIQFREAAESGDEATRRFPETGNEGTWTFSKDLN